MIEADMLLDSDLDAYVDNQLDAAARLRVETFLARHPAHAARVMTDLSIRTTLKLSVMGEEPLGQPRTREMARRLSANLSDRRMWRSIRRVAAVGILVSVGWLAHSSISPFGAGEVNASPHPPAFVEQAVRAHQTALVRESMPSQPEVKIYDRDDIRAATAIVMPELPKDWQVSDVQIFPSDFGPSVETTIKMKDGTQISLFAVRPGHFSVDPVTDLNLDGDAEAAWWQIGEVAYAIVSSSGQSGLSDEANLLKNSLY